MEISDIATLLEGGILSGLFVITFILALVKGVPYLVNQMREVNENHQRELNERQAAFQASFNKQGEVYESSLAKIVATFENQVAKSERWHEKHEKALGDNNFVLRQVLDKLNNRQGEQ